MDDAYIQLCRQRIDETLRRRRHVELRMRELKQESNEQMREIDQQIAAGDGDVDQLEEEKSAVEMDASLMIPKEKRQWERELQADIEPYARALCLRLANSMLTTLPLEIRDQVYSYVLYSKVTVCDGNPPWLRRRNCGRARIQSDESFWETYTLDHYMDSRYVGAEIAREMAAAYYKTKVFYFDYHDLHLLHKFLTVDRFGHGLRPAELVRNVEVVLDGFYACLCNSYAIFHHGLAPDDTTPPKETARICLEQLFLLKSRSVHIRLILYVHDGHVKLIEFTRMLRIIFPVVCQLKELRFRVSVRVYTNKGREWNIEDSAADPIDQTLGQLKDQYGDAKAVGSVGRAQLVDFDSRFIQ